MLARHAPASGRPGMSLLEVLIALAIFLFSLVGIGQLIGYSGQHAVEVSQRGHAAQLAQAKLAEVIAGVVPLSSQSEAAFDDEGDRDWNWSLTAEPDSIAGLWFVEVTVSRTRSDGTRFESKLSQKVLDPTMRGSTLDAAAAAAALAAAASASSSSSSTQSQQNQQQPTTSNNNSPMPPGATPATPTAPATPAKAATPATPSAPAPKAAAPAPAAPTTGTKSAAPMTGGRGKS